ncbi:NAD(P)H-hydrate dehydratase [Ruegeria faecimaris]|uniref:NAD(P)H-hydrate dehydratase n=1 Tax=Ruegeria faecimaris TaxID=686389 RepID=UPI0024930DDB|nr:NAD(P)H-hydrate dehydratase [Ruegeria faecimaris]
MTDLLTAAQMRAIEQAAIESGEVTGLELMERAGQGVVEAIFEEWPELDKRGASPSRSLTYPRPDEEDPLRAVVLCGPGNNGGDGFVVARLLREQGWEVAVFLYGDLEKLPPDARVNYERWLELGEVSKLTLPTPTKREVSKLEKHAARPSSSQGPDLILDALFGTGLIRPIGGLKPALAKLQIGSEADADPWWPRVVSVDIPSGLCADSGRILGDEGVIVGAHLTVTFHSKKRGNLLDVGAQFCGKTVIVDIGLSSPSDLGSISRMSLADLHSERRLGRVLSRLVDESGLPQNLSKASFEHKYSHGHALIMTGGPGKTGAARLAARGALRIGAGLVNLGVPPAAQMEVSAQVTAVMLQRVESADGLSKILEDERLNALCLGPGLGLDRARDLVPVALAAERATVLDADALTAFADDPAALFGMLHENCVLTPHGGEFARLFPDIAEKLKAVPIKGPAYSKVDATREAARRAGCVVLFKGPDTVIADSNGRCSVNSAVYERAAPWLATAGAGDVLAGFITGLLARRFSPLQAAETAAWLHVECARSFGPGLIAEDLPEQLPRVLREVGS